MAILIIANVLVFAAFFLAVVALFRAPQGQDEYETIFRTGVDNVDRNTLFEVQVLRPVLVPLYGLVRRLNTPGLKRHIMRLLLNLGNPNQYSPDEYLVIAISWGLVIALGAPMLATVVLGSMGLSGLLAYVAVGFVGGSVGAYFYLRERALARLRAISRRLPYTLDLIAMAMDAGATFYEASGSVMRDDPQDPFNQELGIVVREIDFGRSRQDALTHLGKRITVDGLDGILSAVVQAEQLGTPLAEVLKLQANLLRMRRSMRAERKAGEAAVKILVPSMIILISVVLIIFGPFLVRFLRGEYSLQ
jgi:tight adherence protein C